MPQPTEHIYIPEVSKQRRRAERITRFTSSMTIAAGIMLAAAIISIIIANTDAYAWFDTLWHEQVGVFFGGNVASMSFLHVINDLLMAIFFLSVGLEIKREVTVGDLADVRKALLPILAAFGGVIVPIVIYSLFNFNTENAHGWGVPTATDIGFALGVLALLGSRIPSGIRLFLSTLAIADDIIAILIIAIFYGETPNLAWLIIAAFIVILLVLLNRAHIYSIVPYLFFGAILWFCMLFSGVHATIAGVLLAFTIPTKTQINMGFFGKWVHERLDEAHDIFEPDTPILAQSTYTNTMHRINRITKRITPPLAQVQHAIEPWVAFLILPLFALANAGVRLVGGDLLATLTDSAALGVFLGLLIGKPIGIVTMSFIAVKSGLCRLPTNVNWKHIIGAGMLGGVGFTMAIFVTNLAFDNAATMTSAKAAILLASTVSGIAGYLFLRHEAVRSLKHIEDVPLSDVEKSTDGNPADC